MTMRVFQSTLPVWGATVMAPCCAADNVFQSTLPVWGATKCAGEFKRGKPNFNPRSPCGERLGHHEQVLVDKTFQSTLPVWGATLERVQHDGVGSISIHAPRVGSDSIIGPKIAASADFNPRSPCGERLKSINNDYRVRVFQSTLPVWGATLWCCYTQV